MQKKAKTKSEEQLKEPVGRYEKEGIRGWKGYFNLIIDSDLSNMETMFKHHSPPSHRSQTSADLASNWMPCTTIFNPANHTNSLWQKYSEDKYF